MPYCPTCKKEYPMGTTICAECNISLVDNNINDLVSFVSLQNQEVSDRFIEYLKNHDIKAVSEYGIRDDVYRIYVNKDDKKAAMKCFIAFQAAEKRNKSGKNAPDTEAAKKDAERIAAAEKKAEEERAERKRIEAEKKAEEERIAAEKKADQERIAAAVKAEEERRAAEQAEAERIAAEKKAEEERLEAERKAEEERLEAERKAEEERIAREKEEAERRAEEERIAREKAEAERRAEEERIAREKEEAERRAEEERIAREKAEAERKAEEERIAREKAEAERRAEEERIAREKAEAERKAEEERIAREKAEAERKAEEERIAREKAEAERRAEEERKAEEERIARVKAEAKRKAEEERRAREKAEAERKAEEERIAREKAEAERKAEEERKAREKAEKERLAAEKKAEEERKAAEKKAAEEAHETEFVANAATRTKRPYYPKNTDGETPDNESDFESIFAAKNNNKKRTTLFAEMEKNEEAASEDSGFDFTPKRPLTAYQFEKKRQEDLEHYAQEHEAAAAAPEQPTVIEDNGTVNISFSNYEQQYEVPTYEDNDPTPVYSDPDKKIDWGAGAEDVTDWKTSADSGEPIFVETERVNNDDIDDDKIIDEADIRSFNHSSADETYVSPVNSAQDPADYESSEDGETEGNEDAFSDFLNNFKRASLSKSMKKSEGTERGKGTFASSHPTPVAVPESSKPAAKKPVPADVSDASKIQKSKAASEIKKNVAAAHTETVVEDIIPEGKYRNEDVSDYESVPSRPTDIQDTKIKVSFDSDIIEEVISDSPAAEVLPNIDQSSSFANPEKPVDAAFNSKKPAPRKFEANEEIELEDSTYRGFVPDYSPTSPEAENTEPQEISEYDEFKKRVHARKEENEAINAQIKAEATRQANLVKDFGKKGKIVFEDTDDLDNYAGFVPDYTPNTNNEEEFDFYKPHQVSSYAKYKKGSKPGAGEASSGRTNGFMRLTSDDEVESLFISHVPSSVKKVLKPQEIKNANFLINMSGKRLSKLFNSWMMLNVTTQTVRAYEKDGATDAENYDLKIAGIKKLLTDNFGEINEVFLDSLVQRYYSKFLDE